MTDAVRKAWTIKTGEEWIKRFPILPRTKPFRLIKHELNLQESLDLLAWCAERSKIAFFVSQSFATNEDSWRQEHDYHVILPTIPGGKGTIAKHNSKSLHHAILLAIEVIAESKPELFK